MALGLDLKQALELDEVELLGFLLRLGLLKLEQAQPSSPASST